MKSHGKSKAVLSAIIFEVILLQSSRFGDAKAVKGSGGYEDTGDKQRKLIVEIPGD